MFASEKQIPGPVGILMALTVGAGAGVGGAGLLGVTCESDVCLDGEEVGTGVFT
jgi:hypothetical protein